MRTRFAVTLFSVSIAALSTLSAPAEAQVVEHCASGEACLPAVPGALPAGAGVKVDPQFGILRGALESQGGAHPIFGPHGVGDVDPTGAAATLRFERLLTEGEVRRLESVGLRWLRKPDGTPVRVGTVYGGFVPWEVLGLLERDYPLVRADAAWIPVSPRPLDVTTELVGAAQAHPIPEVGVDGTGRTILDIDSMVDVLHPHFFRADGPQWAWFDSDDDGVFDAGVDGVDLDGDGELDSRERLNVLDGVLFTPDGTDGEDGRLDPRRDWLYADYNGDGERNVGVSAGFTEEDPTYGEPLFVVDDVDEDGALEAGEPVIALGTSKIRRVVTSSGVYERGENLIDAARDPEIEDSFHGTGVSSILVGGQRGHHDLVGIAPGADLVVHSSRGDGGATLEDVPQLRALEMAIDLGVDVVVHEWTNPYTAQHDGSTNLNAVMDEARRAGIVQVTPLGNLNAAGKHLEVALNPGEAKTVDFVVPSGGFVGRGGESLPYSIAYLSLFWREDQSPSFFLRAPDGTEVEVVPSQQPAYVVRERQNAYLAALDRSERGTSHLYVIVYNEDRRAPLISGTWSIRVEGATAADTMWGRVSDYYSGWSPGIGWLEPTVDRGTLVYPSTADSAFGVAAYAGRNPSSVDVGELRDYSGRGPRIDGARGVDITAPDDPFAAMPGVDRFVEFGFGRSWFSTFGGTSGAGPHVAGAVVLLREAEPGRGADEIEDLLIGSARIDGLSPAPIGAIPDTTWGHGKLDIFRALYGESAPENLPPEAILKLADGMLDGAESSDPDGDPLEFRFDVGVDGRFEQEWSDAPTFRLEGTGGTWARMDVRDPSGAVHGALLFVEESDVTDPDAGGDTDADAGPDADRVGISSRKTGGSCCSSASDPSPGGPLVVLLFGLLLRVNTRRRR